jgi:hypothetical protein
MPAGHATRWGLAVLTLAAIGLLFAGVAVERRATPAPSDVLALLRFGTLAAEATAVVRRDGTLGSLARLRTPREPECRAERGADLLGSGAAPFTCTVRIVDGAGCDAFVAFTAEPRSVLVPPLGGWFFGERPLQQARADLRRRGLLDPGTPCRSGAGPGRE